MVRPLATMPDGSTARAVSRSFEASSLRFNSDIQSGPLGYRRQHALDNSVQIRRRPADRISNFASHDYEKKRAPRDSRMSRLRTPYAR